MNKIFIRNAEQKNLDEIVRLENEIWPEGTRATKEKFEARLKVFPQGFFLVYRDNELIGASTSEIINYNLEQLKSWEVVTDDGYIRNTHNSNGNTLYVVSVGARSRSSGGSALVEAQKKLTERLGLRFLVLGARIPGYDTYCKANGNIDIRRYVKLKREDGEPLDSELRFYTRNGLSLVKIIPNYMVGDKESRNYGVIMIWKNPKFIQSLT